MLSVCQANRQFYSSFKQVANRTKVNVKMKLSRHYEAVIEYSATMED